MIKSNKQAWFNNVFYRYNLHYLLRRHFHSIGVKGRLDPFHSRPILYIANHSCWWDGLLAYHAVETLSKHEHFYMMDEKQMHKFQFFRKLGAFSIDKTSGREILRSLQYAGEKLVQGHRVWMFPQGDIYHADARPLQFQTGIGHVLHHCPSAVVVPVSFDYTLCNQQKPEVTMQFGEVVQADWAAMTRKEIAHMLQILLEAQLDAHRADVVSGRSALDFQPMLKAARTTDQIFDAFSRRVRRWTSFSG